MPPPTWLTPRIPLRLLSTAIPAGFLVGMLVLFPPRPLGNPAGYALLILICAVTAFASVAPRAVAILVGALLALLPLFPEQDQLLAGVSALVVITALVALHRVWLQGLFSLWFLGIAAVLETGWPPARLEFRAMLPWVFAVLLCWIVGSIIGYALRERDAGAARQEQILADLRRDVAQTLHDTLAHSATAIAMHAELAKARVADPVALAAFDQISALARDTTQDVRALMATLRRSGGPAPVVTPQPVAEQLAAQEQYLRDNGFRPTVFSEFDPETLSPSAAEAVVRGLREGARNVVRHGVPPQCTIQLEEGEGSVDLVVTNRIRREGPHVPGGYGVVALTELCTALGGSVEAGETTPGSGTWLFSVRVPRRAHDRT